MKIIQLLYSLSSGGAEKFVVNLSNQLAKEGHDVTICMLLDSTNPNRVFNKQFIQSNVKFKSFGFSKGFSLKKMITVCRYLKTTSPDVVHCHLNVIPYIFPLAFCHKKMTFIHTIHNIAEKASGLKIQRNINRFFYKTKRIVPITISKKCKESFERYYKLNNISYINNGCPPITPSRKFASVQEEIKKLKHTEQTKVFIHIARYNPQKNQNLLINAFNNIYAQGYDFILLIIGRDFNSTLEGKKLQSISNPNIYFLNEKENVGDYLLCSDAFCLSSTFEGLPISLIEAMSCGVTPICTAVGGIPDVITDNKTGYLSDCTQSEFTKAITRCFKQQINTEELIQHYKTLFSMENCTAQYINAYKK